MYKENYSEDDRSLLRCVVTFTFWFQSLEQQADRGWNTQSETGDTRHTSAVVDSVSIVQLVDTVPLCDIYTLTQGERERERERERAKERVKERA